MYRQITINLAKKKVRQMFAKHCAICVLKYLKRSFLFILSINH